MILIIYRPPVILLIIHPHHITKTEVELLSGRALRCAFIRHIFTAFSETYYFRKKMIHATPTSIGFSTNCTTGIKKNKGVFSLKERRENFTIDFVAAKRTTGEW